MESTAGAISTRPWFLWLASLLSMCGCGPGEPTEREAVRIGHTACLSGMYAKAGEQAVGGIEAAVAWVNEVHGGVRLGDRRYPLEYLKYDCESRRERVTSLLERLITVDRVDACLAPYSSGLTLTASPMAEKYGMLLLNHGGASDEIYEQEFQFNVQTIGPGSRYHAGTLEMLNREAPSAQRVALVYEDSEFARMVQLGAMRRARELNFDVVYNGNYPTGVKDLTPLLASVKAARPEILLGGGHFEDGQLLCRQMADLGIEVQALSLIAAATLPAFGSALGRDAEGVMGPSHWEVGVGFEQADAAKEQVDWFGPDQDAFAESFHLAVGGKTIPDYHAAEAAAAVLAWVLAVERAGSTEPAVVRRALGELRFMSFYGLWDVDARGMQIGHSMIDVQWQEGERVIVWPPEARTGGLAFPKQPFAHRSAAAPAAEQPASGAVANFSSQLAGNLLQGLLLGAVYGVATMGLALIFGVLRVVNVGHGALIMLGAFLTVGAFRATEQPLLALPAALLAGTAIGFFFYYTAIRRLLKAPELASLLATFALGVVLEEGVKHTVGTESLGFNWGLGALDLAVTQVTWSKLIAAAGSMAAALGLYFWYRRTRLGTATRAVVQDEQGALACGIPVDFVYALSFAMGTGLTMVSGVLVALANPVGIEPHMGHSFTLRAFVIAVLGGLNSPYGAFFAGLLFGLVENGAFTLLQHVPGVEPFALTHALAFGVLLLVLLFRPTGLMGTQ